MKINTVEYKILIIEDNPGDYALVKDYLSEHIKQPALFHTRSMEETRRFLIENPAQPDVILLDLSLPDIATEDLIDEAKRLNISIPLIILTGYTDLDLAIRSLSVGISDYLLKEILTPLLLYKSLIYAIERHRFLKSLRESQKKYIDIFHLSPEPMWVYERETFRFLDVNEAAVRHYGYSREEFLSMTIHNIQAGEEPTSLSSGKIYSGDNEMKSEHCSRYFRHIRKNGNPIMVEISQNTIEFNNVNAGIVAVRDVSEKIMYIDAIETQNKKLREIAWTQSHVVRAPIARLMGIVDLLKENQLDSGEEKLLMQNIFDSAMEINTIITDIVRKSNEVINIFKS